MASKMVAGPSICHCVASLWHINAKNFGFWAENILCYRFTHYGFILKSKMVSKMAANLVKAKKIPVSMLGDIMWNCALTLLNFWDNVCSSCIYRMQKYQFYMWAQNEMPKWRPRWLPFTWHWRPLTIFLFAYVIISSLTHRRIENILWYSFTHYGQILKSKMASKMAANLVESWNIPFLKLQCNV